MNDGYPAISLGVFFLLVLISAVLYGFASVIDGVNQNTLDERAGHGDKKAARILKLLSRPAKLVNFVHMTAIIVNMLAGGLIFGRMVALIRSLSNVREGIPAVAISIGVAVVMFVILSVFGIFVPKKIFCRHCEKWVYRLVNLVTFFIVIMSPVTFIITKISNGVVRIFGIDPDEDEDNVTEEGIITMVNEGQEQGVLLASEAEMITNIFEFGDKEAKDIMTHRKNIVALDGHQTLNQIFEAIIDQSYSRYPVYDKDIDDIIGILHFKDFVKLHSDGYKRNYSLIELKDEMLFEGEFIPETKNIDDLFKLMQSEKIHMAVVVDEYGQTSGVVTMEDILEEIVGNIMDEHDDEEEVIHKNANDTYEMEGTAELEEIEELLDIRFDNDDVETLNGFLIHKHEKLPEEGEKFFIDYEGYRFHVIEVQDKMIRRVLVTRLEEEAQNGEKNERL